MRYKIFSILTVLVLLFSTLPSCVTIYNYDLSVSGLDSLPSTKACIEKHIPHSVDANKGKETHEINIIINELNQYKDEIIDSLKADFVFNDSIYILEFTIIALDPENNISETDVLKTYSAK
ncbi:MAG: hypothetical protein PHW82_11180 [Bacteroidales bacterium]|nr:hypothetical protein [Bacteroidales bacterium]